MMKKLVTIILFSSLLAGCSSKKLSKEEASKIIKQEMQYPKVVDYDIYCGDPVMAKKVLDAGLEEKGLVIVHRTLKLGDIGKPIIEFTEKAKPYLLLTPEADKKSLIQRVKIADEELVDVSWIHMNEGDNNAVAEYKTSYKNVNDLAAMVNKDYKKQETKKAYFVLYDDGWKLEKR
jgi:hypothetical protein